MKLPIGGRSGSWGRVGSWVWPSLPRGRPVRAATLVLTSRPASVRDGSVSCHINGDCLLGGGHKDGLPVLQHSSMGPEAFPWQGVRGARRPDAAERIFPQTSCLPPEFPAFKVLFL